MSTTDSEQQEGWHPAAGPATGDWQPPSAQERVRVPAGRAIVTMLSALVLASLLSAESLERLAERQPYGRTRDIALAITEPLADVSHILFLDRPRDWLASLTGHDDPPTSDQLTGPSTTAPPASTTTTVAATPAPSPATTAPPPPTTLLPVRRLPTPEAPVRVLFAGDSLGGNVSEAFFRHLNGNPLVDMRTDIQVSTGLARPDVLDWGAQLQSDMAGYDPEVVYLTFGGNDDQPLIDPAGNYLAIYSEGWEAEYARRVGIMMDIASEGARRTVVWIGLPPERPEQLNAMKDRMNAAAKSEAAKRLDVHFVDTTPIFGPDGAYTDDVTLPDGSVVRTRLPDGVHLSQAGADLLAPVLYNLIAPAWHLNP